MPVIEIRSSETIAERLRAFHQGLKETGYVEGKNIAIDYRWTEQMERLTELAAELVSPAGCGNATVGDFATELAAKVRRRRSPSRSACLTTRSSTVLSPASRGWVAT